MMNLMVLLHFSEMVWQLPVAPHPLASAVQQQTSTPRNINEVLPPLKTPSTMFHSFYPPNVVSQAENNQTSHEADELNMSQDGVNRFHVDQFEMHDAIVWPLHNNQENMQNTLRPGDGQYYYTDAGGVPEQIVRQMRNDDIPSFEARQSAGQQFIPVEQFDMQRGQVDAQHLGLTGLENPLLNEEMPRDSISCHPAEHHSLVHSQINLSEVAVKNHSGSNVNSPYSVEYDQEVNSAFGRDLLASWPRQNDQGLRSSMSIGKALPQPVPGNAYRSPTAAPAVENHCNQDSDIKYQVFYQHPVTVSNKSRTRDEQPELVKYQPSNADYSPEQLQQEFLHTGKL
jgi:hypothetical protein